MHALSSSARMDLWLIGSGISASPSPVMQEAALGALGIAGSYRIIDVLPAGVPGVLARMRSGAVRGANVTAPYKAVVAAACDRLEGDALLCGAVNTVTVEDGQLVGDTTDARGFQLGLAAAGLWPERRASAVVVGAGGAAAAVLLALSRAPVESITLVARRQEQAEALAAGVRFPAPLRVVAWGSAELTSRLGDAGLVVNATPAGLTAMPFEVGELRSGCVVSDLRYRPRPVDLVAAAQAGGHPAADGLEMLLAQGMLSLRRWTGAEPPWDAARAALRAAVGA